MAPLETVSGRVVAPAAVGECVSSFLHSGAGAGIAGVGGLMVTGPVHVFNDALAGPTPTRRTDTGERGMSEQHAQAEEPGVRDHVEDVADGCGCTEVWEHLGARRDDEAATADD